MAEIREQSGISSSQASQFFPKERFYIPKSTVQRTKSIITSLNSGIVTDNFKNTASTPYDFVLTANNMSVFDLSQFYFNIAGTLKFPGSAGHVHSEDLIFGNLFITSLFQNATLEIGGAVVALNANPGIDANAQALLKFDQYDLKNYALSDREFMLNQINNDIEITQENKEWPAGFWLLDATPTTKFISGKSAANHPEYAKQIYYYAGDEVTLAENAKAQIFTLSFDDRGAGTLQAYSKPTADIAANTPATGINGTGKNKDYTVWSTDDYIDSHNRNSVIPSSNNTGFVEDNQGNISIPFRCKLYLSDLFNYTVDSLDYIFNRDIKITLTRSSNSNLICNLAHVGSNRSTVCDVIETKKFELVAYSYLLTDTARNELLKFYSRPIETLYGVQTVNLTPLYNDTKNSEQNITLPLTVNYDTKAIILAFPKCSNCLVPLSTNRRQLINGPVTGTAGTFQYSWLFSNCNSYNYAALKHIRISNTNNQSIATYDFSGTSEHVENVDQLLKSFDFTNVAIDQQGTFNDYREIYEQMKQLRLLFGKSPDNAIDYYNFIKDYFIIPIDLTGTNIPPNTRIFVNFQFDNFQGSYHPLHFGNNSSNDKLTTNLLAIYFGRDVLTYNPDGTCIVKHILSANPTEKKANLI